MTFNSTLPVVGVRARVCVWARLLTEAGPGPGRRGTRPARQFEFAARLEHPLEKGANLLGEGPPNRIRAADEQLVDGEGQEALAEFRLHFYPSFILVSNE